MGEEGGGGACQGNNSTKCVFCGGDLFSFVFFFFCGENEDGKDEKARCEIFVL